MRANTQMSVPPPLGVGGLHLQLLQLIHICFAKDVDGDEVPEAS